MNGFIKLHRSTFDHWIWKERKPYNRRDAWIDLLQRAAYAPYQRLVRDKLIPLEIGEQIASIRYLSERWKWGKAKVSAFLKLLSNESMIAQKTRQGETVLIICNYATYNGQVDSDRDRDRTETGQRPDRDRTKKKKIKKVQEGEEDKQLMILSEPFDAFWNGVPNKTGKGAALKAWDKALKAGVKPEAIIAGLPAFRAYEQRRKEQDRFNFRPLHPSTWLNGSRWEDEAPEEREEPQTLRAQF